MTTPNAPKPGEQKPAPKIDPEKLPPAPKITRLIRGELVWGFQGSWPSPAGYEPLPYRVTDIFYDPDLEEHVVFGTPAQLEGPKDKHGRPRAETAEEKAGREARESFCIMARVPDGAGSAISEALLLVPDAIVEVRSYLDAAAENWAARWDDDDDDDEPAVEVLP
jgi:hypothetical protein